MGEYKKYVRNTRFPEGCIAEQYIVQECVTYVNLYMYNNAPEESITEEIFVNVSGYLSNMRLNDQQLRLAHWCVIENCEKAKYFIEHHKEKFEEEYPNHDDKARIKHFIPYFHHWVCIIIYYIIY